MHPADLETYADRLADLLAQRRVDIAERWLLRLHESLALPPNEVFPTDQLLDHIPQLIGDVAAYLRAPADEEIAANSVVIEKARELGSLRFGQKATVHQLLREYEILGELLEEFVAEATRPLDPQPPAGEIFEVQRRIARAARTLMRTTVDTFVAEYTAMLEERNQRLETFNRMASHELRTPIGTLVFASTLLNTADVAGNPERLSQIAVVIRNNTDRLSWLVNNLQRLAQLDGRGDVPTQQTVDVAALAGEVRRQLEEMAATRAVEIRIAGDLPAVYSDPARLELVLLNLVSNAIKYRDPAKPDAFVAIESDPDSNAHWTLRVRDNGLGISPADQDAIFQRFFRAHAHLDQRLGISGSGLGLSIVTDCVQALGGSIRCESRPGRGTTFVVTLPRTAPPPGA